MEEKKYFVGIDPGATGAIALLREDGSCAVVLDYPGSPADLSTMLASNIIKFNNVRLAVLEKVSAMPKQGVVSMFKFGENFGAWKYAVAALGWPHELVTPQRWRKILDSSVPQKPSKDDLLAYARRRWPDADLRLKKHHGRAEALIMAEYARLKFLGRAT